MRHPTREEQIIMQPDFWHQRWQENRIGFHQDRPSPLLETHWDALQLPPGSRVFVPLCGKSLDMVWLAARGHRVLGVELSQLAVDQFFSEHGLVPEVHESSHGLHHVAGAIEIIRGDAFALDVEALSGCAGLFDRAALIALPPALRARYVTELHARLPADCRGLLVTLEYPQHEKSGPPFAVHEVEVRRLYGRDWQVRLLQRLDILQREPSFAAEGVTALHTCAYALRKSG
jgi:thiopurine S-methyltransferase